MLRHVMRPTERPRSGRALGTPKDLPGQPSAPLIAKPTCKVGEMRPAWQSHVWSRSDLSESVSQALSDTGSVADTLLPWLVSKRLMAEGGLSAVFSFMRARSASVVAVSMTCFGM